LVFKRLSRKFEGIKIGCMSKILRTINEKRFTGKYIPELKKYYPVFQRNNGSYEIETEDFGTLDFFPKSAKLLIRKDNTWKEHGFEWIDEYLVSINDHGYEMPRYKIEERIRSLNKIDRCMVISDLEKIYNGKYATMEQIAEYIIDNYVRK